MLKFTSNADQKFIFDPSGMPITKLKAEAKKKFKTGEFPSLSDAQNALSKARFNLSFNKLSHSSEMTSPFVKGKTIYLPFDVKDVSSKVTTTIFVTINSTALKIEQPYALAPSVDVKNDFNKELKYCDFNKTDNGWAVNCFIGESKNMLYLVSKTDEGIVADLWEDLGENSICVDSTYSYFTDLFHIFDDHDQFFGESEEIDANELALKLDHNDSDMETELFTIAGYTAVLIGECSISENGTSNSDFPYSNIEAAKFLKRKGAKEWARAGVASDKFPDHIMLASAVIDIVDDSCNIIKTLSKLPNDLSQLALELAETLD